MVQTIVITVVVTFVITSSVIYAKLVLPLIWKLNYSEAHCTHLDKELFKRQELLISLERWIEVETIGNKKIGEALKLRIREKLELT